MACGAAAPSPELVSARTTYDEAAEGPARELVPADLLEARQALDVAERAYGDDENSGRSRTLAYLAHRKALATMAAARRAAAKKERLEAERAYQTLLEVTRRGASERASKAESSLGETRAELDRQKRALDAEKAALEREKQARAAAEQKASEALGKLEEIAKVSREARGTVITIPGAVLFASGESALLGMSESQLRQVTSAVVAQGSGRRVLVEGHTDSQGGAEANRRLSRMRADAVRGFLVAGGIDPSLVRADGRGEDQPIASNRTAEGRALNRRVEIVVETR